MIDSKQLAHTYRRYGFEEKSSSFEGVRVFTLRSGHYHNADIILVDSNKRENQQPAYDEFARNGFACQVRDYDSIADVENALFKGFFSVDSTRERLDREYTKYTDSVVKIHSKDAKYSFIHADYYINGAKGVNDVVTEITSLLESPRPILFLIEAAAGFGKTCTAYELLKRIVDTNETKIPLFSELARNRQAKLLRYVLLDEIDRTFPILNAKLVDSEIQNGNVPVILDGFDELLRGGNNTDGYENSEPMLETIGALLKKRAKIVLTTRRTVIFDGDEFHEWVGDHEDEFEIIRIKIDEPTITNWLPQERLEKLRNSTIPIERIANPVILSYLRCIPSDIFAKAIEEADSLVDKFFTSMLEREQTRQDLRMPVTEQYQLLVGIAGDMMNLNYTSETRDYIVSVMQEYYGELLENVRARYPSDSRPTKTELQNKLASHALLDRNSENDDTIKFVNEFVQGNFCAEYLLKAGEVEWDGDARFIEPMVTSCMPRSKETRLVLWNLIKFNLEFVDAGKKIKSTIRLLGHYDILIDGESIENIMISDTCLGKIEPIQEAVFVNCTFNRVCFNRANLFNITFVSCNFYGCELELGGYESNINLVHILGCTSDIDGFLDDLSNHSVSEDIPEDTCPKSERYVLEKFWPVGKPTFYKHRPISLICSRNKKHSYSEILEAIKSLRKRNILLTPIDSSFLELNKEKVQEVMEMLERSV